MTNNKKRLLLALLFFIPLIVYAGNLRSDFVYDDNAQVLTNRWITSFSFIPEIFASPSMYFLDGRPSNTYRPLFYLIYIFEYKLFGLSSWGFHLVNMVFHSLNATLVFVAAMLLTGKKDYYMPFFSGLVFALHPINTEAVSWVAAIPELSYTFFLLASFCLYLKGTEGGAVRRPVLFVSSVFVFLLAMLSKETGIALLLIIPLYEFSTRGRTALRSWRVYAPFLAAAVLYMALRTYVLGGVAKLKGMELTFYENVINVFPLVARYLGKLVFPAGLSAIYSINPVHSVFEPMALYGFLVSIAFLALLFLAWRAEKPFFFLLLLILVPLLPVLYMPALSVGGFADRYLYLPSAAFAISAVAFGERALVRRGGLTAVLILLLAVYSAASVKRSMVWRDDYSLWSDAVKKSPDVANVQYNLGWSLHRLGRFDEAAARYREALRLSPGKEEAHYNLALVYQAEGERELAEAHFKESLRLRPDRTAAYYNLAFLYQSAGDAASAIPYYEELLSIDPSNEDAHFNLARAYEDTGDYGKALGHFEKVVVLNPRSADALYRMALIRGSRGEREEALRLLGEALLIRPDYGEALRLREKMEGGR